MRLKLQFSFFNQWVVQDSLQVFAIATTSPALLQPLRSRKKSQSQIAQCEWALSYCCQTWCTFWRRSLSQSLSKTSVQPLLFWTSDDVPMTFTTQSRSMIMLNKKNTSCFGFHYRLRLIWLTFLRPESRLKTMCNNKSNVSLLFFVSQWGNRSELLKVSE